MAVRARLAGESIVLEGDERARGLLGRVDHKLRDLRWLWGTLTDLFTEKEKQWFRSGGQGAWPALSPAYAAWKARVYPGRPVMVREGDLRDQLTQPAKAVVAQTDEVLFLGTTLPYAAFHLGGPKMPARPPLIPRVSLAAGLARRVEHEMYRLF